MRHARLIAAIYLATFLGFAAMAGPMRVEHLFQVRQLGSPQLSPDGRTVLFTVRQVDWDQNSYVTHVWRVATSGGSEPVQLTYGKASCYDPQWSPDGQWISFRSDREEKTQLFLMRADGGEAFRLTRFSGSVGEYAWHPSGTRIYFLAADTLDRKQEKRRKDKWDAYLLEKNQPSVHLWEVTVPSGAVRKVVQGEFSLRTFRLSPDGERVAFIAAPSPNRDDDARNEIYLYHLQTGRLERLTENQAIERSLEWVPDGSALTFISDANENLETYYQDSIFWLSLETRRARDLLPGFPWQVLSHAWMTRRGKPDRILFTANCGVTTQWFSLDPLSGKWERKTDFPGVFGSFHYRDSLRRLVCLRSDFQHPADLYILDPDGFRVTQLTRFNAWLDTLQLARAEIVRWNSSDGVEVEGILILPPDYSPARKYPLALQIHGGPESSYQLAFSASWATYPHVLAGAGYAILQPNYRGSTGYGDEWMRAIIGHYFEKDWDDLVTGVEAMIQRGVAHPDSLVVHGWSAGGHLTNWAVTHTDRFRAAASGAGGADWFSFYAQTDMRYIREIWHASSPYDNWEFWLRKSPVLYAKNARTPTLIFCGENDPRVPFAQSREMYVALKRNGCPVEFVAFPREGHSLQEPRHQVQKIKKEFNWFEHYVRGAPLLDLEEIE
ncbi:MAG: S9 family peptidase [candidate division KSB1 bacterium]|nr:S9 family peptidase [candidate division KSB1 bacterium]